MCSPRKNKMEICREQNKQEDVNIIGSSKRLKSNSEEADDYKDKLKEACLQVSRKAYHDIATRFQIFYLPNECKNCTCIHRDKNVYLKKINSATEQCFKHQMENNSWCEALELCLLCTTPNQYLSPNMLKDIVKIIMNAHDDINSGWTIDYVLKKCQHTLSLHFNMHLPCMARSIRDCYKDFLLAPIKPGCEERIVANCITRLLYEITKDSRDDTLLDKPDCLETGVKELHWKKANLEIFEFLIRTERIKRLMLVMESIIHLLQMDLGLLHIGRSSNNSSRYMRSQQQLIASILWPKGTKYGTVSTICENIMKLYAYFVHLHYPEEYIKIITSWINVVINMFYISETNSQSDFPNILLTNCRVFTTQFYKVMTDLPIETVTRMMERLPCFMQHLIGEHIITQSVIELDSNILDIIDWYVENSKSKDFAYTKDITKLLSPRIDTKLESQPLLNDLAKNCRMYQTTVMNNNVSNNTPVILYPKQDEKKCNEKMLHKRYLGNILLMTLKAYLETYNLRNLKNALDSGDLSVNAQNAHQWKASSDNYLITSYFVGRYKGIVERLIILKQKLVKNKDIHSRNLLKLINNYWS